MINPLAYFSLAWIVFTKVDEDDIKDDAKF
jgi:hypothetical protein